MRYKPLDGPELEKRRAYRRAKYAADPEKKLKANRKWRGDNPEKMRGYNRRWKAANPEKSMLASARERARIAGVPYNLVLEDIVIPEKCPVLDIPLFTTPRKFTGNSPSLDRRYPELGYVKGNVSVISHRANQLKNNANPEELLRVALYFQETPPYVYSCKNFIPGKTSVRYSGPFFDNRETTAAVRAILHGKWATSGEAVVRFQNEFGRKFNLKNNLMVNSGSSANLVMLAALKKRFGWKDGSEIIVSPVGFATTIAPIVQNGLAPRFVDIELDTLNFSVERVKRAIRDETVGIFVSPVLGNPPDMDELSQGFNMIIGDNCDSLGTRWGGKLWTDYCYASSTSFYPAHHLSTIEGGLVSSNDEELINLVQSFSSWGRACYCVGAANLLPCGTCNKRFSNWLGDDAGIVDHKFVFDNIGYNLKVLDLQGAIGLEQLKKFDEIETKRKTHAAFIRKAFNGVPGVRMATWAPQAEVSWFGVPLICDTKETRNSLVAHLEAAKIQTRSYFGGNVLRHPGFKHLGNAADYPNAQEVFDRVFFLGCAPHYSTAVLDYIREVVSKWQIS